MKVRSKIGTTIAAAAAIGLVLASPANAMGAPGTNLNKVSSPGGIVTGLCTFTTDVPDQSFNNMTIAIKYEVWADQPAIGVNGICVIKDAYNKTYGQVSAAAPGMVAANTGTVVVPQNIVGAKACNTPEALWMNGGEANPKNLTTCKAL